MKYILEVFLIQLLFLGIYELFLKKETFFQWNRFFLLLTFGSSFLLPFIQLPDLRTEVQVSPESIFADNLWMYELPLEVTPAAETTTQSGVNGWMVLYLTGVLIALVLFAVKLLRLFQLRAKGVKSPQQGYELIRLPDSKEAFSFFNWVFLGDQIPVNEERHILEHEAVHIGQRHTFDLLFFELLRIVCWFNPLVYLYQTRLSEVHEFAADRICAKGEPQAIYLDLLSAAFGANRMSFVNQFAAMSLLRKRITMLKRAPSGQKQLLRFALILPLVLIILTYTSCEMVKSNKEDEDTEFSEYNELLVEQWQKESLALGASLYDTPPQFSACESAENPQDCFQAQMQAFIQTRLKYPEEAKAKGIEGVVPVVFEIDEQGDVQKIRTQSDYPELQDEAVRIIGLLPRFIAAKKNGQAVAVPFAVPIRFQLSKANAEKITPPIFPGCENAADKKACFTQKMAEYLTMSMEYPAAAEKEGLEGKVQVVFTFNKQGQVEGLKARSDNKVFEKEALRLIQELPDFTPAMRDGKPTPYPMAIPIQFKLSSYPTVLHSCADLIAEYSANFEKKKNDLVWVKTAVSMLYSSECSGEPLFQKLFEQQLRMDPSSDTYFYSGVLKEKNGDLEGALSDYEKAADLETNSMKKAKILYNMASQLRQAGRTNEATTLFRQAAELNPTYGRAKLALAKDENYSFPVFPGCEEAESSKDCFQQKLQEYIIENMEYPEEAVKNKIEGRVSVVFTILKDGSIGKIAMRGSDQLLEKEAFRMVQSLPKMVPGKRDGQAVETPYSVPIEFRLN